jgi:3-oxoacyl-[acyl-carrier protein] reductase
MEIAGKNIVVTGGARGMGRQFAVDLLKRDAHPYVIDVNQENLDRLAAETGIEGRVVDVTDEGTVESFFETYAREAGPPDVLINNAGITADGLFVKKSGDTLRKFQMKNWQRVIDINLTGVFLCGREAGALMIRHGVGGLIINISSISRAGNFGQTNYSATKAGVAAMTVSWAKELAKYGIRSAAVAPGYVKTEMVAKINSKVLDGIVAQIPVGRLGEMAEISKAVQFIIECDFFNGRVLAVDGGQRL